MTYYSFLTTVGPVLFWSVVLASTMTSLCFTILALRVPRRLFVILSASTLALAIVFVALPHPQSDPLVNSLVGIAVFVLAVLGGGPAVLYVLAMATKGGVREGSHGGILIANTPPVATDGSREVLRGGTTIGLLERLATVGAIMAGFPGAIAVLVAVKSVGRFSELNAAESRERFIIGTLVSLIWACACAALFRFTLG